DVHLQVENVNGACKSLALDSLTFNFIVFRTFLEAHNHGYSFARIPWTSEVTKDHQVAAESQLKCPPTWAPSQLIPWGIAHRSNFKPSPLAEVPFCISAPRPQQMTSHPPLSGGLGPSIQSSSAGPLHCRQSTGPTESSMRPATSDSAALALLGERATALDQKAKAPDPKTG
ncbi:hypothetical protein DBR06_SOUSAS1010119, partial [Sousa chinensis]